MKYSELLEKYVHHELDDDRSAQVEADIDRHEAISNYLFDQEMDEDIGFSEGNSEPSLKVDEQTKAYAKLINQAIRRAFLKVGIGTACIILAVVLGLSPLMDLLYYNPAETVGKDTNRLSLDWGIWSELNKPANIRQNAIVFPRGYGKYTFTLEQNMSYVGYFTHYSGSIARNSLQLYTPDALNGSSGNLFANQQLDSSRPVSQQVNSECYIWAGGTQEKGAERLKELDENRSYYAYVTLDQALSLAEVQEILKRNELSSDVWYAIRTTGGEYYGSMLGMWGSPNGVQNFYDGCEKYSWLTLLQSGTEESFEDIWSRYQDEEIMTTHFLSMLRYISDQQRFREMVGDYGGVYSEAISYVEQNGLQIYGFVMVGQKEQLIELNQDEQVFGIYAEEIR